MIIFDLDGTLWDTLVATEKAVKEVVSYNEEIENFDINVVRDGMGLGFKELAKKYFPYLDEEKSKIYLKQINSKNMQILESNGAKLYDGVCEIIKELSKLYKLGIITNNNDDYIKIFYKISNLKDCFIDSIGTSSYGISKAEAIKIMIERNHEHNNWYVGDIKKDMLAAKEAKIEFIHAKYGFEESFNYKHYINDIKELPKLLNNIVK